VTHPLACVRRARARLTGRLTHLPILALEVHSACNCRCVMCDIWQANAERREISAADLDRHLEAIDRLGVRRVMLTGGEPLLHTNLWALCARLKARRIRVTLVTTGLLVGRHAGAIARFCDEAVVSLDGDRDTHDAIRRVPGAFDRILDGLARLKAEAPRFPVTARVVVQRQNYRALARTVAAARQAGFDRVSFLAADVTSQAFGRREPWTDARRAEVAIGREEIPELERAIDALIAQCAAEIRSGFVENRPASLRRIVRYYRSLAGVGDCPPPGCNAPWVSAVVDPDGFVRPCFFHPPYGRVRDGTSLADVLNSATAIRFRRTLDVARDPTCRRCVCWLKLRPWARA
jgi:MoaA/NifB/PqqE/SkfB family radical SAM enzyme